jgi:hypothetical protein
MHHSCCILEEHGDREKVSNEGTDLIKAQYTGLKYQGETPLNYQYTLFLMKDREVKQIFSGTGYQWEGWA